MFLCVIFLISASNTKATGEEYYSSASEQAAAAAKHAGSAILANTLKDIEIETIKVNNGSISRNDYELRQMDSVVVDKIAGDIEYTVTEINDSQKLQTILEKWQKPDKTAQEDCYGDIKTLNALIRFLNTLDEAKIDCRRVGRNFARLKQQVAKLYDDAVNLNTLALNNEDSGFAKLASLKLQFIESFKDSKSKSIEFEKNAQIILAKEETISKEEELKAEIERNEAAEKVKAEEEKQQVIRKETERRLKVEAEAKLDVERRKQSDEIAALKAAESSKTEQFIKQVKRSKIDDLASHESKLKFAKEHNLGLKTNWVDFSMANSNSDFGCLVDFSDYSGFVVEANITLSLYSNLIPNSSKDSAINFMSFASNGKITERAFDNLMNDLFLQGKVCKQIGGLTVDAQKISDMVRISVYK